MGLRLTSSSLLLLFVLASAPAAFPFDPWPAVGQLLSRASQTAFDAGDFPVALRHAQSATALSPADSEAWFCLGMAQGKTGNRPAKLASLRKAIELDASHFAAWKSLVLTLHLERDEEAMQLALTQLARSAPDEAERLRQLVALIQFAVPAQDPAPTLSVDVRLVRLATSVTRPNRSFVTGLEQRDFHILDDGADQPVKYFWRENDLPLTIAIIVDISGSQLKELKDHQRRVRQFLRQVLRPRDRALLVTVAGKTRLIHDLTPHADVLADDVERLSPRWAAEAGQELGDPCRPRLEPLRGRTIPCGGSVIWNSVYWTARRLREIEGRKAILLLTDGEDTGSDHSLDAAIRESQISEAAVYSIGVRASGGSSRRPFRGLNSTGLLRLAEDTGGVAFLERASAKDIFAQIELELRNQYVLGFSPSACDDRFHRVEVRVPAGLSARFRRGYYATGCVAEPAVGK